MSAFCRKLRFLVIFMIFYFIVCRIQEFLNMRHGWDWLGMVDPMKIRVNALKAVLAGRGISSESSIERQDLVDLVRSSGRLTGAELAEVAGPNQSQASPEPSPAASEVEASVTNFVNAAHFDELVEDCKDSAWFVEIRQRGAPVVSPSVWLRLNHYLRPFEIRIGRVECQQRTVLCSRKAFHHSGLLLAMPRGRSRVKDSVTYSWFKGVPKLGAILRWLGAALATRVPPLEGGLTGLTEVRNGSRALNGDFLVALDFDRLPQLPLLFSTLSVRFTGRIRFWRLDPAERAVLRNASDHEAPATSFLVSGATAQAYEYGARLDGSEPITFRALALFLKMNYPEANDSLIGLSYPVAMLALLSLALRQKSFLARLIACAASLVGYGLLFLLLYLPAEHLLSLQCLQGARAGLLGLCQLLARSEIGARLRRDCLAERYSLLRIGIWFAIFLCFVAIFESRRASEDDDEDIASREEERSRPTPYIPEAAQMDHMVNYLYSSLWLPPDEWTKDYVDRLPVWSCAQDLGCCSSDEETLVGDEEAWPSGALFCRQCSVCLIDFRRGASLCHLPCGHVFHERCVKRWLRHPDTDSCPVCRWPAFKVK